MNQINPADKKEILEKVEEIEKENRPTKKKILILRVLKWLDGKSDRIWYQTMKACFDSLKSIYFP